MRVMIVDDDPDVRRTLGDVLGTDPGVDLVATATNGREALAMARAQRLDVVLLDIRMPHLDGLDTLDELRRADVRVIMLTTFGEADYVRRAIAAGADGFLLKAEDPRDLLRSIHGTMHGETWLSPVVARFAAQDVQRHVVSLHEAARAATVLEALTPREGEVAGLLAQGMSNAEIGRELFLSESTVKAYVGAALSRLGLRNRVELAAMVWKADVTERRRG